MCTEVKILHASCCGKQSSIKAQLKQIANQNNLELCIEELFELSDTMQYGAMTFPSLVINNKVYAYRQHQSDDKLLSLLNL